jgi:hypothetical protein
MITIYVLPVCLVLWLWFGERIKALIRRRFATNQRAVPMLPEYVKAERKKLSDLAIDENAFIYFTDVAVNRKGKTFVDLAAKIGSESGFSTIEVQMRKGGCILILPKQPMSFTFTPRRLYPFSAYIPVIQILQTGSNASTAGGVEQ